MDAITRWFSFSYFAITMVTTALPRDKTIYYVGKNGNYSWPRRELSSSIPGNIILGALHMVHERSEEYTCGPIMSQGGIQALETMLFTLDYINESPSLLPHIRLGMLAKDDCDRDIYGLEQAVDFIRGLYWHHTSIFLKHTCRLSKQQA